MSRTWLCQIIFNIIGKPTEFRYAFNFLCHRNSLYTSFCRLSLLSVRQYLGVPVMMIKFNLEPGQGKILRGLTQSMLRLITVNMTQNTVACAVNENSGNISNFVTEDEKLAQITGQRGELTIFSIAFWRYHCLVRYMTIFYSSVKVSYWLVMSSLYIGSTDLAVL